MPKKRAPIQYSKPSSPAHPSLSSSTKDASHSLTSSSPTGNTVSDRIQQLRLEQKSAAGSTVKALEPPPAHTVHPSIRQLLRIPDGPSPRPRPGLRVVGGRRGPAGPRAPDSWLNRRRESKSRTIPFAGTENGKIEALPGTYVPILGTLLDLTLKELASSWVWHMQYDQYYLATLPVRYKEVLLRYIALYNPQGIDASGLQVLFLDESELEDATGAEGFKHLELAGSIGHPLPLKELKKFFTPRASSASSLATPISADDTPDDLPDSWESPTLSNPPASLPRFHSLTHLSLSHPHPTATWKSLLDLSPHLQTLTHLSLAHWPTPTLTPNASTAYTASAMGNITYSGTSYYSALDNDWSEAASILRRLAKNTLCLQWLDLTGTWPWVQCLSHEAVDWTGAWAGVEVVRVGQGWVPGCLREDGDGGGDGKGSGFEDRWKDVWQSKADLLSEEGRKRRQLHAWAFVEKATLEMEERVKRRLSAPVLQTSMHGASTLGEGAAGDGGGREMQIGRPNAVVGARARDGWLETTARDGWSRPPPTNGTPTTMPMPAENLAARRSKRLVFDRAWSAGWIKEAVEVVARKGYVE